ncbi:unnamed protein product [Macrosiphum euphorbiae]|uniref:Uncharacterized protein n=1 Tax=Macrosiphum euphorbiae TaxID=13131 RepID=A0AAV0X357_9HEMI|nr:unnamed protein product [Macrosiphum euphorbiae]
MPRLTSYHPSQIQFVILKKSLQTDHCLPTATLRLMHLVCDVVNYSHQSFSRACLSHSRDRILIPPSVHCLPPPSPASPFNMLRPAVPQKMINVSSTL